jgi:hypothetical protein
MESVEHNVIEELVNITLTIEPTIHEFMPNSVAQDQCRYYVDMPIVSIITNLEFVSLTENLIETSKQIFSKCGARM